MMGAQEVSLSWNGHHRTLVSVFESLLDGSRLVDCTIAAQGQRLKAHKEILSAFSPYFELIFREENEDNPTVILSGITFEELRALIDFMYFGKVKISEDKVEDLIDAAESLQIKGLGGGRKQDDSESINESWNSQTEQNFSSDISGKHKRKRVDMELAENGLAVCVGQIPSVMSQSKNADFSEVSLHTDTSESSLSRQQTSSSDMDILRPESVVKVELGADDSYSSENNYDEQKNDTVLCKHGNDLPSSAMILTSSKNVPASSYKESPSGNQTCTSGDSPESATETRNVPLCSEVVVKSEPKTEEVDIPSEPCFAMAAVKEERLEESLVLEDGSECHGREVGTKRCVENANMYSGAAYAGPYNRWLHPGTLLPASGLTMETRGPGGTSVVWPPSAAAVAGCSGEGRGGVRRGAGGPRPPRKYSCPECHKVFNQSCNLKVHLRIHTGEKPYKCTECDFAATHISNLKQHLRTHSGERPYKCTDCDYAATDISSFKRHQRMHNGERPYKCTECDYAATDVGSFKRHQRIHSGERPYKCTECDYAAPGSGDLRKHQRVHNRERPEKDLEFDSAVTGTSNLINSIPKYFENFNIYR